MMLLSSTTYCRKLNSSPWVQVVKWWLFAYRWSQQLSFCCRAPHKQTSRVGHIMIVKLVWEVSEPSCNVPCAFTDPPPPYEAELGGLLSHSQPSSTPDREKRGRQDIRRGEQSACVSTRIRTPPELTPNAVFRRATQTRRGDRKTHGTTLLRIRYPFYARLE